MAAHHFCCCLPLRLGAFLISLFQFLLSGIAAAALWYGLAHWRTFFSLLSAYRTHPCVILLASDVSAKLKGATVAAGVYYTILALAAFIG